jgi:SAM-dependent methyltransferase
VKKVPIISPLRDLLSRLFSFKNRSSVFERQLAICHRMVESDPAFSERFLESAVAAACKDRLEGARHLAAVAGDRLLVDALRARSFANDSLVYAHHVFAEVEFLARKHGVQPRTVLEIGPGVNLGSLFCFVASGVENAAGVDVEPMRDPAPAFYRNLYDYLSCVEGFTWWRYFATERKYDHVSFPTCKALPTVEDILEHIDYRSPAASDRLPFLEGSFDLVYSVAAMEHVPGPSETVAEITRVLRPGGLSVHEIDLKDHGAADPLEFLTWSNTEYQNMAKPYGNGRSLRGILDGSWRDRVYCNRLRLSDWLDLFYSAGFEILETEPILALNREHIRKARFAEPFRSKNEEDLSVLAFRIVARAKKS